MFATMSEGSRQRSPDNEPHTKNRNFMMSPMKAATKADGFEKKGQAWFVVTELQSDLVVQVAEISFHLHKFPLLSRSGRLNRLVFESRDTQKDHIKLLDMPGGAEAFELAAKFCYGVAVDLTASNIASLRCAAEYLEMTEDLEDGNLISKTEAFLSFVVLASWKDSIIVLQSCEFLKPWAENLQIVRRCSESIAWKACTDPRGISWSFTCPGGMNYKMDDSPLWNGLKCDARKVPQDWWFEDVSTLRVEHFVKVITAIRSKGMRSDLIGTAVEQYAEKWLPGLDGEQEFKVALENGFQSINGIGKDDFSTLHNNSRRTLESIVAILPAHKDSASCSFLLRLLRMANMLHASATCRKDLEKRVGLQLEQATLSDLMIPSFSHSSDTLFDVDLVHRLVENFLLQEQKAPENSTGIVIPGERGRYEGLSRVQVTSQNAKTKVAKLIDNYLAEVARDVNMSIVKFVAIAEELPEYARAFDDGLYRAIDTYLKAHPGSTEAERKRLCRIMDCQKLSIDACMHAAQNERLPLRVVVQVLFCEHVKLRNAITGRTLAAQQQSHHHLCFSTVPPTLSSDSHSHTAAPAPDNAPLHFATCSSPRHDIRDIKLDVEKIKGKFAELQTDYAALQRQMERLSKGGTSGSAALSTPSARASSTGGSFSFSAGFKKLVRAPGQIFNTSRLSIDEPQGTSAAAAPQTPSHSASRKPLRRWRNSIS